MNNRTSDQSKWKNEQKSLRKAIGYKLQLMRDEKSLSQSELSEMTGISASYISVIERGEKSVSFFYIARLASALQASLDELAENDHRPRFERAESGKTCGIKKRRVMELLDQSGEEELDLVYYEIMRIRKTDRLIRDRIREADGEREGLLQTR